MNTGELRIRPAEERDLAAMCNLLEELFSIETDFRVDRARQWHALELLLARANSALVLVAERSGRVVGMCTVQILISTAEGAPVGLVEDMVVTAQARGCGIGACLLAHVEAWARERGLTRLQLLADRTNEAALEFYAREGWQATRMVGLRKHP